MKIVPPSFHCSLQTLPVYLLLVFCSCWAHAQETSDVLSEEDLFEEELDDSTLVSDPLESVNRVIFCFNDFVYTYLGEPVSDTYELLPNSARQGVENFFDNLRFPVRLTGNLLQGRVDGAWLETRRFVVNSTAGLFGVLDLASDADCLQKIENEDMGQALGSWGLGEGAYLVLPFMGPSNVRDLFGLLGDRAVSPWVEPFSVLDSEERVVYSVGKGVSMLPSILELYEQMKGSAIDPYSSLKNAFTQYRRSLIEK
ncbi:MAG: VacJ family lipoprotein [Coraliomargaritaceae bacterium]